MPTVPFPIAQAPDVTDTPQAGYLLVRNEDNTGYEHKPPSYVVSRPPTITLSSLSDVSGTPVAKSIPIYQAGTDQYELRPLVSSDISDASSNSLPSKLVKRTGLGGVSFKSISLYNDIPNLFIGNTVLSIRAGQYQNGRPLINLISYDDTVVAWFDENGDAYLRNIYCGFISADWVGSVDLVATGTTTVNIQHNIKANSAQLDDLHRWTDENGNKYWTIDAYGNFINGSAALLTTATDGFLYIPTCNGAPIGTPRNYVGRVPIIYDNINDKIYVYNGSWKSITNIGPQNVSVAADFGGF